MNFQTIAGVVALLLVVAGGWWLWSNRAPQEAGTQQTQHVAASQYKDEGAYHDIEVDYPEASAKARVVMEQHMGSLVAEFKANAQLDALTPEDIEIQGLGGDRKYTLKAEVKAFVSGETRSYLYAVYEDMLGAHPNGYYKTFVFDAEGSEVELGTVLASNPNWLEELSLLVSNDVSAQYRARTGVDDLTGLLYPEGLSARMENFQNWYLDQATLVIMIPPYQVAAYAVGSFEVRIPLSDLK